MSKAAGSRRARIVLLAAGLAAATALGAGPAGAADDSAALYQDARRFIGRGDLKTATIHLKNALRADKGNVQAREELARLYLRQGDGAGAEAEIKTAREAGLSGDKVVPVLAEAYLLQGKMRALLAEIDPTGLPPAIRARVLVMRAQALNGQKRPDEAMAALDAALADAPDLREVRIARARLLLQQGREQEAEAEVDQALAQAADDAAALLVKGEVRRARDDAEGAAEAFGRIIAADGDNIEARLRRAMLRIGQGRDADAKADSDAVLARAKDFPLANYVQALLQARAGHHKEAYATLSPHQEALSGFAPAIYLMAALSLSQDNVEQAQSLVQRYLGMSGDDIAGHRLLASIFLRKKAYDRALQILDPLAREQPRDSTVQTLLGYARMGAGHANEAAAAFAKAAEAQPDNNRLRTQLAYNQMLAGEDAKAIEQLQGLISRDPQDIQAILLLILGHLQHREYEPALKAAEDLKRAVPDTPIADNFIGVIQMSRDNEAAARTAFSEALRKRGDFLPAALNLAELDLRTGKPEAARLHYDTMLRRNPNQQEALMGMARVERAAGHSQAATEWLEKAARADVKAVEPRLKLVDALLAERRTDKALMVARELVQALPAEPSAHDALGQAQMAAKDSAGAVVTYQQAIQLAPRSAMLQHRLGMALIALDRKQEGEAALERAVALDAGYMPAWQERLDLAYRQGGLDAALDVAKAAGAQGAAASLEPWLAAEAMARAEHWKEAAGLYRTAMERAPNAALARRLHMALMRSGDTKAARGTLEGWLKDHPEDAESRLAYAVSLIETGDMGEAIRQHESLLTPYPNNATLYNNLAWLYDRIGDTRALDYARRAQTLAPDSPDVADTLGWLLVRNGQPQRGLELLKKAYEGSKDQGNQATIAFHLASALSQAGARNEARQILEPVLASDHAFDERTEAGRLMDQLTKR